MAKKKQKEEVVETTTQEQVSETKNSDDKIRIKKPTFTKTTDEVTKVDLREVNKPEEEVINKEEQSEENVVEQENTNEVSSGEEDKPADSEDSVKQEDQEQDPKDEQDSVLEEITDEEVKEVDKDSKIESLEETLDNVLDDTELTSKEISKILEERENPSEPTEALKEAVSEFDLLKKDVSRRGVDIDGDGTIDGYDNTGDGLIDEVAPASSRRAQYVLNEVPFYARPNFNWGDRSKWINNQNAVNYWLTYIKNEKDTNYPDDFSSKTY